MADTAMTAGTYIRTVTIAGLPLRLYTPPHDGPDHPWASLADLAALAQVDEQGRVRWQERLRTELPGFLHVLPDGAVIVAQPVVGGLFHAWAEQGHAGAHQLLAEWDTVWAEVFASMYAHLPPDEFMRVVGEAGLRNVSHVLGARTVQ